MSKHPQARLRSPDYWSSKVDPYHFDENPTRALTLVEALQDAKTYYNIPAEIGKAGAWLPERYKTAASHERALAGLAEVDAVIKRWNDLKAAHASIRESTTAHECDRLIAEMEQHEGFRVMREYEITAYHWVLAVVIKRLSEEQLRRGRHLHNNKLRLTVRGHFEGRRYKRTFSRRYHKLQKLVRKMELTVQT